MALEFTQPLRKMSTRNVPRMFLGRAKCKAEISLLSMGRLSRKYGILDGSQHYGPLYFTLYVYRKEICIKKLHCDSLKMRLIIQTEIRRKILKYTS
jgi:hypothetical protein